MVAEELLLGWAAVYVVEEGVLVETDLRRHAEDQVLPGEGPTVDFIFGKFPLPTRTHHRLELLQVTGKVLSEAT